MSKTVKSRYDGYYICWDHEKQYEDFFFWGQLKWYIPAKAVYLAYCTGVDKAHSQWVEQVKIAQFA